MFGNYGLAWKFHRKLFITALRQYLSDATLIERRVSTQAEKLVKFMDDQSGKPFDPAVSEEDPGQNVIALERSAKACVEPTITWFQCRSL